LNGRSTLILFGYTVRLLIYSSSNYFIILFTSSSISDAASYWNLIFAWFDYIWISFYF